MVREVCALAIAGFSWKEKAAVPRGQNSKMPILQSGTPTNVWHAVMPLSHAPMVCLAANCSRHVLMIYFTREMLDQVRLCVQMFLKLNLAFSGKSSLSLSYHKNNFKMGVV